MQRRTGLHSRTVFQNVRHGAGKKAVNFFFLVLHNMYQGRVTEWRKNEKRNLKPKEGKTKKRDGAQREHG